MDRFLEAIADLSSLLCVIGALAIIAAIIGAIESRVFSMRLSGLQRLMTLLFGVILLSLGVVFKLKPQPDADVPVGSIMASVLPPDVFLTGDNRTKWALADGSPIPSKSAFDALTRDSAMVKADGPKLPDLRGLFLRGLNFGRTDEWADPDGTPRYPGHKQPDQFKEHSHKFNGYVGNYIAWGGNSAQRIGTNTALETEKAGVGSETRPKNAAVYYYIKVN